MLLCEPTDLIFKSRTIFNVRSDQLSFKFRMDGFLIYVPVLGFTLLRAFLIYVLRLPLYVLVQITSLMQALPGLH